MTAENASITRGLKSPGLFETRIPRESHTEYYLTLLPQTSETPAALLERAHTHLASLEAETIRADMFAPAIAFQDDLSQDPLLWIEGTSPEGQAASGLQIHALQGAAVVPVEVDGQKLGCLYEDHYSTYCWLNALLPDDPRADRAAQAEHVFQSMEQALGVANMDMSNLIRTWFFNDSILNWYAEFNQVRTPFYRANRIFDNLLPASTGIGGANPLGAALAASAFAMKPKGEKAYALECDSPRQGPAASYGSSFSRAVEVVLPGLRQLLVSGTASIDREGRTLHAENPKAQVSLTMEIITALLEARGMQVQDISRAVAYFKSPEYLPPFRDYCRANGFDEMPVICSLNDICRADLLFEIEVDAIMAE